jgi:dienelactone hydrolase
MTSLFVETHPIYRFATTSISFSICPRADNCVTTLFIVKLLLPPAARLFTVALLLTTQLAVAQAPPATGKQVPPPGAKISDADRRELESGAAALRRDIDALARDLAAKPNLLALLPDVEVFHKAVDWPLRYDEFMNEKQAATAKALLKEGVERAKALRAGQAPWTAATGAVMRGYRSRIDGSVQPYGVVVPAAWKAGDKTPRPLWLWMHGRGENLTELAFIAGNKPTPDLDPGNGFFVRVYGRFCNASKFAGETDLFEAMQQAMANYPIDPQRVLVTGFSMGGASCWHIAAHHAGLWAAASPGAGFAETAIYAKVFENKKDAPPPWWQQVLWHFCNATDYAANLANTHLIAYSGEIDPQKQSADIMEKAMAAEGLKLERLIGPKTAHKYEPETKKELEKRLQEVATKGAEAVPAKVHLTTYTLRYNTMKWVTVDALEKHWERADVDAQIAGDRVELKTRNVAALRLVTPSSAGPLASVRQAVLDGAAVPVAWSKAGAQFHKENGRWAGGPLASAAPHKTHGLTGPIDDAFMDSFIFVRPTGRPLNDKVGAWAKSELERAIVEWRRVFRGEARVKNDTAITADDVANSNLVLWGDPSSNAVLARVLAKLPIRWTASSLTLGSGNYSAADHTPILIFPNPLNPNRYVVLNSGFTFREGSTVSNSQQTPKLPDWAIIDLRTPPDVHWPGLVVDAGFFDEHWELPRK